MDSLTRPTEGDREERDLTEAERRIRDLQRIAHEAGSRSRATAFREAADIVAECFPTPVAGSGETLADRLLDLTEIAPSGAAAIITEAAMALRAYAAAPAPAADAPTPTTEPDHG